MASPARLFARLARDTAGNTLAIIAAALIPLLGMVGGGVDISRGYLAQSRLQQACDAGVLAARKRMGSDIVSGRLNSAAQAAGNRFFDINFRDKSYGSIRRTFAMKVEADYSVSGLASVVVPTTVMSIFGYREIPLRVECEARLNMSNTDVMMVLDVTGSMAQVNPGDSQPKIAILRQVVKDFHAQLEAAKTPGTRVRYGFVPYSSNVNVGYLLKSDWVVDKMTIQSRVATNPNTSTGTTTVTRVSGTMTTKPAYTSSKCPESKVDWTDLWVKIWPNGDRSGRTKADDTDYQCVPIAGSTSVTVTPIVYDDYVFDWYMPKKAMGPWTYKPLKVTVKALKGSSGNALLLDGNKSLSSSMASKVDPLGLLSTFRGCIMERKTYEIGDYDNVDLARAIDLDIDRVPDKSNPDTQWRPLLSEIYLEKTPAGKNVDELDKIVSNLPKYLISSQLITPPTCPPPARKVAAMTAAEVSAYVNSLSPAGNTYHDIGMIWGGRLLSPTGIFAADNADEPNRATTRHLIFLTDGETATNSSSLVTYGIEPADQLRWRTTSTLTLNKTVENRFTVACNEVKKKNITVWVIAFGTSLNPMLTQCAGGGHYFEANNAKALSEAFSTIARQMGDLRISK